jgi:hypothetical protein
MSSLISIKIGDKIKEDGPRQRVGTLLDIVIVPNGVNDPSLVALLYVKLDDGGMLSATSDRFEPITSGEYTEFYPSSHFSKIKQ